MDERPDPTLGGRTNQKRRTRDALLEALRELLAEGKEPSVAEVAAIAGISRTTAYRYFPDQRSLLAASLPDSDSAPQMDERVGDDPVRRLDQAISYYFQLMERNEAQLWAGLRATLPPGTKSGRSSRAIGWYADALQPLLRTHPRIDIVALATRIRAAVGIEPLIWLIGAAGLTRAQSYELMRANAQAILRDAMLRSSVRQASTTSDSAGT